MTEIRHRHGFFDYHAKYTANEAEHLFGTDEFGRDLLSRVIHGTRLTLQIGLIAVGISLSAGLLIGLVSGYAGGWVERILMRGVDVLMSFTETLIALAAVAVLGPSLTNAMIAVGIAAVPVYARVTYSVTLVERNKPYFEAAYAAGAPPPGENEGGMAAELPGIGKGDAYGRGV